MTITASLICVIAAFVFFLLAAFGVPKVGWRDLGYAALVLAYLLK